MIGDLYGVILATSEPGRALVRYTQADRTIVSAAHAHDDERADQKCHLMLGIIRFSGEVVRSVQCVGVCGV